MNYLVVYSVIFIAGYLSSQLGIWLIGGAWFAAANLGIFAGLAAVLSALLISQSYLVSLKNRKHKRLYLKALGATLLSHFLFGLMMAIQEQDSHSAWDAFVVYLLVSVLFGFIPNLLFSLGFTALLINHKKPRVLV